MDHHLRRRVADNKLQFRHGEAVVQWQEDRAEPEAGELHLHRVGRVQRENRDAVAASHLQRIAQMAGQKRDAFIELAIGKPPAACEIDQRDLAWTAAAVMGDPVIVTDGHGTSPAGFFLAAATAQEPRSNSLTTMNWLSRNSTI